MTEPLKPLSLATVMRHTKREMTRDEAYQYVSRYQARQITRNQALALSLHSWNNTDSDWLRLQACLVILGARK